MSVNEELKSILIREEEYPEAILNIEKELSPVMTAGYFDSFDGNGIYYEYYKAENAKANIVVLHGFTEFTKKFAETVYYFTHFGFNVFIYDHRGHGNSYHSLKDPHLAHVDSFDDYVKDLECYMDKIVSKVSPGLPCYMFAHSMGCAVGLLYMQKYPDSFEKAVLSSPLIYPGTSGVPLFLVKLSIAGALLRKGAKERKFKHSGEFDPNPDFEKSSDMSRARFESNLEYRRRNVNYQNSSVTNGWLWEAINSGRRILSRRALRRINASVLVFTSDSDTVVRTEYHRILCSRLKNSRRVTLVNAKHTPFTGSPETIEEFFCDTISFYLDR